MSTLTLWLPMPPKEVNSTRMNWGKRHRLTTEYFEELDKRCPGYHIPRAPEQPFARARIRYTFYADRSSHFMDPDNRRARLKRVLDWLQRRGYLVNDRDANVVLEDGGQELFTGAEPELCSLRLDLTELPALVATSPPRKNRRRAAQ